MRGSPTPRWLFAAILLCAVSCGRGAPRRSALLITLDTTRADALSCYGGRAGVTPNLDRLAAEGVLYERASTVAPLTLPAHASMLTGLYPPRHGLRDNAGFTLPRSAETLAELARGAGCQTGAFVAAVVLDPSFGLDQGFDRYDAPRAPESSSSSRFVERKAAEVVDAALAWITARDRRRPYFLWVHLFEPHGPYEPPPDLRTGPFAGAPYLGEVASADREIGRLLEGLRAGGAFDDTTIVFASDHGEAFGEHGEHTHGAFCWQTTLHVPLIVRDGVRRGLRSRAVASVADVFPTLLAALGVAAPAGIDGRRLDLDPPPGRGVYFESYAGWLAYGWSHLAGWADERVKYLHSSEPLLFDLDLDPGEARDLVAERREEVARSLAALEAVANAPALARDPRGAGSRPDLSRLGYTGTDEPPAELPRPSDASDRPSPHARAKSLARSLKAQELANRGQVEQAILILAEITGAEPENFFALDRLATCLLVAGRSEEALEALDRVVHQGPQWAGSWFNYGVCLQAAGREPEALHAFERASALDPGTPMFRERWEELRRASDGAPR